MTNPLDYVSGVPTGQLKNNRRGGLIAYGVISIVLGTGAGCIAGMVPVGMLAMRQLRAPRTATTVTTTSTGTTFSTTVVSSPTTGPAFIASSAPIARMMLQGMAIYGLVSAAFIWTGVASCRCRRWVRPMILSLTWPWLVIGLLAMVMLTVLGPEMAAMYRKMPGAAGAMPNLMVASVFGFMVVFYVVLPGAYLLFYQRRDVQQTLAVYDPRNSWTERCPLPVFGLSVNLFLFGMYTLWQLNLMVVPFFGTYLTSAAAIVVLIVIAALFVLAAVLCYRLRTAGWWLAVILVVAMNLSWLLTFLRGDDRIITTTAMSTYGGTSVNTMNVWSHRGLMAAIVSVMAAICLIFLLKTRRHFGRSAMISQSIDLDRSTI